MDTDRRPAGHRPPRAALPPTPAPADRPAARVGRRWRGSAVSSGHRSRSAARRRASGGAARRDRGARYTGRAPRQWCTAPHKRIEHLTTDQKAGVRIPSGARLVETPTCAFPRQGRRAGSFRGPAPRRPRTVACWPVGCRRLWRAPSMARSPTCGSGAFFLPDHQRCGRTSHVPVIGRRHEGPWSGRRALASSGSRSCSSQSTAPSGPCRLRSCGRARRRDQRHQRAPPPPRPPPPPPPPRPNSAPSQQPPPRHRSPRRSPTSVTPPVGQQSVARRREGRQRRSDYVCDGTRVEAWLQGPAVDGVLPLRADSGATLTGSPADGHLAGTVTVDGRTSPFTAAPATSRGGCTGEPANGGSWTRSAGSCSPIGAASSPTGTPPRMPSNPARAVRPVGPDGDRRRQPAARPAARASSGMG